MFHRIADQIRGGSTGSECVLSLSYRRHGRQRPGGQIQMTSAETSFQIQPPVMSSGRNADPRTSLPPPSLSLSLSLSLSTLSPQARGCSITTVEGLEAHRPAERVARHPTQRVADQPLRGCIISPKQVHRDGEFQTPLQGGSTSRTPNEGGCMLHGEAIHRSIQGRLTARQEPGQFGRPWTVLRLARSDYLTKLRSPAQGMTAGHDIWPLGTRNGDIFWPPATGDKRAFVKAR